MRSEPDAAYPAHCRACDVTWNPTGPDQRTCWMCDQPTWATNRTKPATDPETTR